MDEYYLTEGSGRTRVELSAQHMGEGLILRIYNDAAHIGAVAVADFDFKEGRAFSSVISLPGHRDDELAKRQAHIIARHIRKPVCVVAGVHLGDITREDIIGIQTVVHKLVESFLKKLDAAN